MNHLFHRNSGEHEISKLPPFSIHTSRTVIGLAKKSFIIPKKVLKNLQLVCTVRGLRFISGNLLETDDVCICGFHDPIADSFQVDQTVNSFTVLNVPTQQLQHLI